LTLLTLAAGLVPFLAAATIAYVSYRATLQRYVSLALADAASTKLLATRLWLEERRSDARALSAEPALRCAAGDCPPGWTREGARVAAESLLVRLQSVYGVYHDLTLMSPDGTRLAGSSLRTPALPRVDAPDEVLFTRAHNDLALDVPVFEAITPLRGERGVPLAYLVNRIRLTPLARLMEEVRLGETGESYLVNGDGLILTESRFVPGSVFRMRVDTRGYQEARAGRSGSSTYTDYRGRRVLGAYRPVPGTDWILLAEMDADEAFAPLRAISYWFLGLLIIGTATVSFVGAAAARRVAATLERSERELAAKQEQLIRSGRLATVGEIAAGIAHEINNPLTTLKLLVESIGRNLGPRESLARDVEVARGEIDRIHTTMLRFLALAAPADPVREPTDLNEVVTRILVLLRHQIERQGIVIESRFDRRLAKLFVDPSQIGQAILNVLLNAVQATPKGGTIAVATQIAGEEALLTVEDSGPGIPSEDHDRVLEPFYTTKARGTGLGLTITRSILVRHGGGLVLGSSRLGGAEVTFRLPLIEKGTTTSLDSPREPGSRL
jgi:two-component system NtrC family sensor kinase